MPHRGAPGREGDGGRGRSQPWWGVLWAGLSAPLHRDCLGAGGVMVSQLALPHGGWGLHAVAFRGLAHLGQGVWKTTVHAAAVLPRPHELAGGEQHPCGGVGVHAQPVALRPGLDMSMPGAPYLLCVTRGADTVRLARLGVIQGWGTCQAMRTQTVSDRGPAAEGTRDPPRGAHVAGHSHIPRVTAPLFSVSAVHASTRNEQRRGPKARPPRV